MERALTIEVRPRGLDMKHCEREMRFGSIATAEEPSMDDPLGQYGVLVLRCVKCYETVYIRFA